MPCTRGTPPCPGSQPSWDESLLHAEKKKHCIHLVRSSRDDTNVLLGDHLSCVVEATRWIRAGEKDSIELWIPRVQSCNRVYLFRSNLDFRVGGVLSTLMMFGLV